MSTAPQLPGLRGHAYAARSSHRQPARLITREGGEGLLVDIQNDERAVLASAYLKQIRVDAPLGSAPRKVTFPDGAVFETTDHDAIEALTGRTRGSVLHHYEGFNRRLFGVVAACLAAAWVLWPLMAQQRAAANLP